MATVGSPSPTAAREGDSPVVHEPIPSDPREDLAMGVALDGDLPAAIQTPEGVFGAPDPLRLPTSVEPTYAPGGEQSPFRPDRDTRRPDVTGYDDPFTPSTVPFKRLQAVDSVRGDYELKVYDERLVKVPTGAPPTPDDAVFFADMIVDVLPDRTVRIPSVGPGARIVRARLGVGASEIALIVLRDGADNWFLEPMHARSAVRARLVMEVAIPRAAFGGKMGDPAWGDLLLVAPLPDSVAREAAQVRRAIGVSRAMRPREAIAKLVQYFRAFADSDEPPQGRASVYLDLALSRKGVCRHRAFAFLVTAQSLGVPTRLVFNEAHAWVEIHDGSRWRRLDLGGAGRFASPLASLAANRPSYEPPPDMFRWPQAADRGENLGGTSQPHPGPSAVAMNGQTASSPSAAGATLSSQGGPEASSPSPSTDRSSRPPSSVSVTVTDREAHRGFPLHVAGIVKADDEPCAHVAVELWIRSATTEPPILFGTAATDDDGAFTGGGVVPSSAPLGDYDVIATTEGDSRCGRTRRLW
jgi:transglutaminase-like putative cysteine protease